MLRKIKLYGKLAKFIGHRVLEADVATAAEAVRFLVANWPEVERHMADQHYRVSIGTYDIDLEELHHPAGAAPISFVPVVAGAGALGRIIIGDCFGCIFPAVAWCRRRNWRCAYDQNWLDRWGANSYWHSRTFNSNSYHQPRRRRPTQEL
jgi:predicted phage tail protein